MPATGATTSQNTPHENKVFSLLCRLFGRGLYSPTLTNGHNAKELGMAGKLQVGFYWVKTATIEGVQIGHWEPAFFNGSNDTDSWEMIGIDQNVGSYYFDEIGESIPSRYQPTRAVV